MLNDIRFAFRQLRKSPGFTFSLCSRWRLGSARTPAIFSLIHDLFLRGLPFSEPKNIVHVYGEAKERDLHQTSIFNSEILALSRRPKCFHQSLPIGARLHPDWLGDPVQVLRREHDRQLFRPLRHPSDSWTELFPEEEMKDDVALVTELLAQTSGSDPQVIGRTLP